MGRSQTTRPTVATIELNVKITKSVNQWFIRMTLCLTKHNVCLSSVSTASAQ
jgi:hypothetical protein